MLGYFFFGATLLFYIGLTLLNLSKPPSGQNGMGLFYIIPFLAIGFAISSLILTLCVGWKNGFDWVSTAGTPRNLLIGGGWLSLVATTIFCIFFKWEWHQGGYPLFLRWLALANGQVWIPLLMLVPYFFLLNTELRASVSLNTYKIPLMICFALSVIYSMGLLFGLLRDSAQQQVARMEQMSADEIRRHDEHLSYIAEQKPTDGILNILALTGRFHAEDVREAALDKIKSHPNWEDELIDILNNDYYYHHVYTFIDGNKVEHPEKFLKPLNQSILWMANDIRKSIKDSNNLQDWHFEHFGIERLFRAIDEQFLNKGMDFRPAVLKLQEALKTTPPERFKNVRFTVTPVVNEWLKKH
jgi:hypothetical protein